MKKIISFIFAIIIFHTGYAQYNKIDSLKKALLNAKDSTRANILNDISGLYLSLPVTDTGNTIRHAEYFAEEAYSLSARIHFDKGMGLALFNKAAIIDQTPFTKKEKAFLAYQKAIPYLKKSGDRVMVGVCLQNMAEASHTVGDLNQAIIYFDSVSHFVQGFGDTAWSVYSITMTGHCYFDKGDYQRAYQIGTEALKQAEKLNTPSPKGDAMVRLADLYLGAGLPGIALDYLHGIFNMDSLRLEPVHKNLNGYIWVALLRAGDAYLKLGELDSAVLISKMISESDPDGDNKLFYGRLYAVHHQYDKALNCFTKGFDQENKSDHTIGVARLANELGRTYLMLHDFDSALVYANVALQRAGNMHALLEMRNAAGTLNDIYVQTKDYARVYRYSQLYKSLNDSLAPEEYKQKLALVEINNELDHQKQQALLLNQDIEIKAQQLNREALIKKVFIAGILLLIIIAGIIFRSNKQKQKANILLSQQKEEVQSTLTELKSVQAQLIQSAKMASLGELTAGIAHEIQNPLNFVNNFSDLNTELIEEMKAEWQTGDKEKALVLANDIIGNEKIINQHGKRAEAIVKGMLQHSQNNIGTKEPVDLNSLIVEWLRLSYNGFATRDKSFKTTIRTELDKNISMINMIPQDIGRLLLNLFNNAFYAVTEKKKLEGEGFEAVVQVSSKKTGEGVEITVKDNGGGVPAPIADKIFQPFFTTKPTGQGTGLGLSISYDIVKAHGGKLKLENREGEGAIFILYLPFYPAIN